MTSLRHTGFALMALLMCTSCSPQTETLTPSRGDWMVMGTSLDIVVYRSSENTDTASDDLEAAYDVIAEIDRLMSLYLNDSDLVRLNERAGRGNTPVNAHTFKVLEAAHHYSDLTDGAFDITIQPLVDLWGFYRVENAAVPSREEIEAALQRTGSSHVTLVDEKSTAALPSGSRVDLGAIAKGYAVDLAVAVLRDRGVPAALVNLGGMIRVLGEAPGDRPWIVGIRHPRENSLIGEVHVREGAVATSGDYDRYFETNGKRYSHIIDPRTGWPVEGVYSVTVYAPTAMAADALSTAAFVLGPDQGLTFLAQCDGVSGVFVEPENAGGKEEAGETLAIRLASAGAENSPIVIDDDPSFITRVLSGGQQNLPPMDCLFSKN